MSNFAHGEKRLGLNWEPWNCAPRPLHNYFFVIIPAGDGTDYDILVSSGGPGHFLSLHGATTLESVKERYWKYNKPLELFYTRRRDDTSESSPGQTGSKKM